jgi:hypothetical protein
MRLIASLVSISSGNLNEFFSILFPRSFNVDYVTT